MTPEEWRPQTYYSRSWEAVGQIRNLLPQEWPIGTDVAIARVLDAELKGAIADEREACARAAEDAGDVRWPFVLHNPVETLVAAIRNRSKDAQPREVPPRSPD